MLILPAIDLKNGKCVRLTQGLSDQETVYETDPAAVAKRFEAAGAAMLHLVDLDGAFRGATANLDSIKAIRAAVSIPIELGGGMRSLADMEGMLALGIDSVIVGTTAVRQPEVLEEALQRWGGEKVQLGIDAHSGKVAVQGWEESTALDAVEFAQGWAAKGATRAIFTDIAKDGMMQGPNLPATEDFAVRSGLKITASGGVSSVADLKALATLQTKGVERAIVGKAIYEGAVTLEDLHPSKWANPTLGA